MCCLNSRAKRLEGSFEELPLNERSMIMLAGDDPGCPSYNGNFQATHFYIAGYGTPHEKMFLRNARREAIEYATEHGVKVANLINATSFCSQRILALVGS